MTEFSKLKDIPKDVRQLCLEAAIAAGINEAQLFNDGGYFRVRPNKPVEYTPLSLVPDKEMLLAMKRDDTRVLVQAHKRSSGRSNYLIGTDSTLEEAIPLKGHPKQYRGKHRSHNKGAFFKHLGLDPEKRLR